MAKYSEEFGTAIRSSIGDRSAREVSRLTGGEVSHTLIREIRFGYVPSAEIIVSLARALEVDPNMLLDAAGKPKYLRYVPDADPVT